jgi:stage IV sporulation protein FB
MFDQSQMQPTPFDLRWQMFGIPVRVHPFFWLVTLLLGGSHRPLDALIWVFAVFISILVHELGHALTAKSYGSSTEILLYSFGGLAFHHLPSSWVGARIVVLFAGPGAGFLLAAVVWGVGTIACGDPTGTLWDLMRGDPLVFLNRDALRLSLFLDDMLWINIWWGLMNLLPAYPLDGGQICRTFLTSRFPTKGEIWASQLSIVTALGVVAFALTREEPRWYLAALFGLLAFDEIQRFRSIQQRSREPRLDRWD